MPVEIGHELEESVEEKIVLALFDLVNHLTRNGERMAAQAGLTVQQFLTLLQIAGDPNFPRATRSGEPTGTGLLASEMASARGISRASVSSQVSALIRKGLVRQVEDPEDRRRKELSVTEAGREALAVVEPSRRRANRKLFRPSTRRELEELHRMLDHCLDRLGELRPRRRGTRPYATAESDVAAIARAGGGGEGR